MPRAWTQQRPARCAARARAKKEQAGEPLFTPAVSSWAEKEQAGDIFFSPSCPQDPQNALPVSFYVCPYRISAGKASLICLFSYREAVDAKIEACAEHWEEIGGGCLSADLLQVLSKRESSAVMPRRKRQALNPEVLQQKVSGYLGRLLDENSLFKIMPYLPNAPDGILSGRDPPKLSLLLSKRPVSDRAAAHT